MMEIFENYSTYIILASLVVFFGIYITTTKNYFPKKTIIIFLISTIISTFIGARLLNFLTNTQDYIDGKINLFDLNFQGFSLYGGLALALIVGFLVSKIFKINILKLSDLSMPFIGIGISIVRIGCFVHGCCFGKQTKSILAIHPKLFSPAHIYQINSGNGQILNTAKIHPTQIYEMLATLFSSLIAFYLLRKKVKEGIVSFVFVIIFTSFRLLIYFFRVNTNSFNMSFYFYPIVYLLIILSCLVLVIKIKKLS